MDQIRRHLPRYNSGGLLAEFVFRSKFAWLMLAGAGIWVWTTGEKAPCFVSDYFEQGWYVLCAMTVIGALYTLWSMARTQGTPEYEDVGTGWFTVFAILLAIWSAVLCGPAG